MVLIDIATLRRESLIIVAIVVALLLVVGVVLQGLALSPSCEPYLSRELALSWARGAPWPVVLCLIAASPVALLGLVDRTVRGATVHSAYAIRAGLAVVFLAVLCGTAQQTMRTRAFATVPTRMQPLVEAIERYEAITGHPPGDLSCLVPDYLPAIPTTGIPAYPEVRYYRNDSPADDDGFYGNPWSLHGNASFGLSFDSFFYLPRGKYPAQAFGGRVVPLGTWAYVIE